MAKSSKVDENKQTAASYVIGFYQSVNELTHHYANYNNFMAELGEKFSGENMQNLDPDTKDQLKNVCNTIRYYAIRSDVSYRSIMKGVNKNTDSEIKQSFLKIKDSFIIKVIDVEEYVIKLNEVLTTTIMRDLLSTSNDLVNQLYGDQAKEHAKE